MSSKYFYASLVFAVCLALSPCYGDWETEANDRIELIRKRDAQITVLGLGGVPVPDVDVQIEQIKHRFGFGTCLAYGKITNPDHQDFVVDHFEWAVCENEMKWSSNESTRDVWTFSQADYIADWCADNDITLRGHNLVWETGGQTPGWVSGLECETYPTPCEMLEEIDERINYTVGRYAGQIVSWDVDNEMLSGNMFDCLGEAGRAHFFQQGNSVDPNCGFYMNEYSGNSFGGYDGDAYASRANGLIALGAPVEGLGIQAHVASPFNPELYYSNVLQELAVVGVPIIATEFDTDAGSATQAADDLENLYRICFSHPLVEGIIMWGYDQNVWRGNGIVNSSTWTLNEAGVRYEALMDEWTTNDSNTTDGSGNAYFRGFHGVYEITLSKTGETTEIHEIELEPGGGTQLFVLETDFSGGGLPGRATYPSPDNGVSDVSINTDLSWTAGTGATSHDVYFGTTSPGDFQGNQPGTTFDPGTLSYSTAYYWRIDEVNDSGTTTGDVWSFTTVPPLPGQATDPSPDDGVSDVSINTDLSWTAGSDATSHDVYFGTTSPGDFQGNQPGTTFDPGTLSYDTTYYWRIDEKNVSGTTTGDVWSFTTSAPDTTPPTPDPCWASPPTATGPTSITMTATTATDAESPPVYYYFECTNHGDASSDWQTSTTYVATGLIPNTQYTFRVKARDSALVPNETGWSTEESATTEPPPTDIEIIGSWETGTSHPKETGTNRALIFIAHNESPSGTPTLTSVTYDSQVMTKVVEITASGGTDYKNYVAAFILNEADVNAATSGDFDPTWSATPGAVAYASVFLQNVDQTTPIGDSDSAGTGSGTNPIETGALSTEDGDMVIIAATCGNLGSYTLNNGFTEGEGTDHQFGDSTTGGTGVAGHKSATGVAETPKATYSATVNRQVLIGFVVQAAAADEPPAPPTGLVATAGNEMVSLDWNNNSESDLAGYNVYRSTTQGSGYGKINTSLVGNSDYIDNDVDNGTPYYYVVTAVDEAYQESGYSNEDSATPDYQNCADVQAGGDGLLSDLDGDCYVNYWDLETIAYYWLNTDCDEFDDCEGGDFEPDGDVDFVDFSTFAPQWLQCNDPCDPDCIHNWP